MSFIEFRGLNFALSTGLEMRPELQLMLTIPFLLGYQIIVEEL